MIDHIGVRVGNIEASSRFYDAALEALGYHRSYSGPHLLGYGPADQTLFWLHQADTASSGTHIAFAALDRTAVEAFHAAGLTADGTDNGRPGLRLDYGPAYFAAFLLDPDGNNIEAVCNREEA